MRQFNITRLEAQEVQHKVGVLCDERDLREEYGISQIQADDLFKSIPANGGEWIIPDNNLVKLALKGELLDHVEVLRDQANDLRSENRMGQALATNRLAKRLERIAKTIL
jgi:hypothetical protein